MPFIEADLGQDYEDKPVAEGRYDLRIRDFQEKTNSKGAPITLVIIEIEGHGDAAPIFHNLSYPVGKKLAKDLGIEEDTKDIVRFKMQLLTRFLNLFNIPFEKGGFSTEDLPGATASDVFLAQTEFEGVSRNEIKLPPVAH